MKRIGFCMQELGVGGVERVLLDLIVNLKKSSDYELYLLVRYKSKDSFFYERLLNEVKIYTLHQRNKNKNKIIKLYNSIRKRIVLKMFEKKIDVIVDFCGPYCYNFIKNFNMKKITFAHLSYEMLKLNSLHLKDLKNYDLVVACGEGVYKDLEKDSSIKNIDCITNLIDYNAINSVIMGGGSSF